jgi:hypothetical protein
VKGNKFHLVMGHLHRHRRLKHFDDTHNDHQFVWEHMLLYHRNFHLRWVRPRMVYPKLHLYRT